MPKKKGKKGKKGKGEKTPIIQQFTTPQMLADRTKMLCPRLGDAYDKAANVENILTDVSTTLIKKAARKHLEKLELQNLKMSELPNLNLILPELQSLQSLNLSKNHLFSITTLFDTVSQLENIKIINLSENFLNGFLPESAAKLTNLEELNLDGNQVVSVGEGIVDNWTKLRSFSMQDNGLTAVPEGITNWTNIEFLNLKNNAIAALPESITDKWKHIKKIYLGSNALTALPEEIGNFDQLIELDVSNNALEALPNSLGLLYELELLHLGNNKLLEFQSSIFTGLRKLRELQLYKNKISVVGAEIGNLRSIERLSLASNQIKYVPEEIGSCVTLKELYLSNNAKLSYIPPSAGHLRNLQELKLYKCPAMKQVPTTIHECTSLKELDLRGVKKNVCKIAPECMEAFKGQKCVIRGAVVKKIKADLKPPAGASGGGGGGNETEQPAP
eukprot:GSChrysophyteH1.ASY1.ANO1.1131.1 assembled CDS